MIAKRISIWFEEFYSKLSYTDLRSVVTFTEAMKPSRKHFKG